MLVRVDHVFARPVPEGITYATAPGTDLKAVLREFAVARADMFVRPDGKVGRLSLPSGGIETSTPPPRVSTIPRRVCSGPMSRALLL